MIPPGMVEHFQRLAATAAVAAATAPRPRPPSWWGYAPPGKLMCLGCDTKWDGKAPCFLCGAEGTPHADIEPTVRMSMASPSSWSYATNGDPE